MLALVYLVNSFLTAHRVEINAVVFAGKKRCDAIEIFISDSVWPCKMDDDIRLVWLVSFLSIFPTLRITASLKKSFMLECLTTLHASHLPLILRHPICIPSLSDVVVDELSPRSFPSKKLIVFGIPTRCGKVGNMASK